MTDLEILDRFNEKVDRLHALSFTGHHDNAALIEWNAEREWDDVYVGPNDEKLEALVLTLRFFIQNNEPTSLRNMRSLYQDMRVSADVRSHFVSQCDAINRLFDAETHVSIQAGQALKERAVFEIFTYGRFAHANTEKRKVYQALSQTPFFPILQVDFAHTLSFLLRALSVLAQINRQATAELTVQPWTDLLVQASASIAVDCYAGCRGDETPRRFRLGDQLVEVHEVVDRWLAPDHRYFKIKMSEGETYALPHNVTSGRWEVTVFGRSAPA